LREPTLPSSSTIPVNTAIHTTYIGTYWTGVYPA
jgi:hypothetical protein